MLVYAADDEELALDLLCDAITEAMPGVTPVSFHGPEDLLRAAEENIPDIVFMDINMPGMNGIETARKLNELSGEVKIIFVTGYSEYAGQAFDVYASGYLMKPCRAESIKPILQKIGLPLTKPKEIFIKTFGNFDIFYHDKPIAFRSGKGKELLAYLVDREGTRVSRQEIAGILYEDDYSRSVQTALSKIAKSLSEDLLRTGLQDFFATDNGYYVNLSGAEVDFIEYRKGNPDYRFTGEYMQQYSWGEDRKYAFSD